MDIYDHAEQYNWEECKQGLIEKLVKTNKVESGTICMNYFLTYLPRFQAIGGSKDWFSNRIDQIRGSRLFLEYGNILPPFPDISVTFQDARIRTVKWALFNFWSGARFSEDDHLRASKLSDSIASMITIFRIEYPVWVPELYLIESRKSTNSREYGKLLWLDLASRLDCT